MVRFFNGVRTLPLKMASFLIPLGSLFGIFSVSGKILIAATMLSLLDKKWLCIHITIFLFCVVGYVIFARGAQRA